MRRPIFVAGTATACVIPDGSFPSPLGKRVLHLDISNETRDGVLLVASFS